MQRVKRSTAVAVLPAPPSGGVTGFFAKPDPAGGVPATVPGYEWYNGVQEEIMAVIEGAGLSGSSSDHTLMRQAIGKMIQGGQRSVIINGVTFAPAVTGTGKAVYWDSGNSRFDLALADGSAKQNCVGFADVANSSVYCFGDAVLFTGLTPGSRYYLDGTTAGSITTTAPATNIVFVGIARNATEIFVDVDAQASSPIKQQQSVSAAVAANALTIGLNPTSLDFRNPTLTSGAPNTRTVGSALSLTVPSGATLGTASGRAARLVLLAIDNAGTVELAIINQAGIASLFDESNLINTTAISGASNSAAVCYSVSARTGVPFRIVGFIDITEATAGTWASAPTLVQGAGGQALAAMSSVGYGQSWQDVLGSRAVNTTYYNTTGKPIVVSVGTTYNTAVLGFFVNGVQVAWAWGNGSNTYGACQVVVPAGASYSFGSAGSSVALWAELR